MKFTTYKFDPHLHNHRIQLIKLKDKTEGGLKMESKNGTDNEGQENKKGYCQAVSGLCEMTPEYDRMFTAEGKCWQKYKQNNPDMWNKKIKRFEHTRGTIFTERLLKCIKWIEKKSK